MVGERFDSGGVLERARPILTFATIVPGDAPAPGTPASVRDPVSLSWSSPELPPRVQLPVLPRIVRRTWLEQLLEPFDRAARLARRGAGLLLFGALGLATLGTIAGLGLRSLPEDAPTLASTPADHVLAAVATERLLARAPQPVRVERTILPLPTPPPATPSPAARVTSPAAPVYVAVRTHPAPTHANLTAARGPKKHPPPVVAHR
jgi:hypothetical protein